eukprot:scaffold965_cov158-Amphora_coffeaeformis.AAC.14
MSQKYTVDWKVVLGEGAYGSVHPARLAATGEKVRRPLYNSTHRGMIRTEKCLAVGEMNNFFSRSSYACVLFACGTSGCLETYIP